MSHSFSLRALALPRFSLEVEKRFQLEHVKFAIPIVRFSIPLGIVIYLSFFLWDYAQPGFSLITTFSVRFLFVVFAAAILATTFLDLFERHAQVLLFSGVFFASLGVILILYRMPDGFLYGYGGICLAIMYASSLMCLQFRTTVYFVVGTVLLANLAIVFSEHSRSISYVLLNTNFFLCSFGIAGTAFAYVIEHSLRRRFGDSGTITTEWFPWTRSGLASTSDTNQRSTFLCYRREDSADVTGRIQDHLSRVFGSNSVIKDVDVVPLGSDFRVYLGRLIKQCDVVLLVIGQRWLVKNSEGIPRIREPTDVVRAELELALNIDVPIIPVLVQGVSMPGLTDLPDSLKAISTLNAAVVRPDPDFHSDMEKLLQVLQEKAEPVKNRTSFG